MGRTFKTIDAAIDAVNKALAASVWKDGVPLAKTIEAEAIQQRVYDVYPDPVFGRTGKLKSKNVMHAKRIGDTGYVELTNTRREHGRDIAKLVYGGDGFDGLRYEYYPKHPTGSNTRYLKPRDFISPTIAALDAGGLENTVQASMENKGYQFA